VTVNVLGRNLTARIANLREVKWESLALNFVMVFSSNALKGAPHNLLATVSLPEGVSLETEANLGRVIGKAFPSVTVIRVKEALAAVNAILARDAGLPLALQLLIYPGCAAHQDTPSHTTFARGLVLEEPAISWFFGNYVQSRAEREDWRFAPLHAPDVDGVAPAWIGLAECDPLVDEGIAYADKLRLAGVQVDLDIYRGVTHEFIKMGRAIPEARKAHADAARALRLAFGME
jgi:hypothetical protein